MFIKNLKIDSPLLGNIQNLNFFPGFNLIVDETPERNTETGNSVGKTTILRLIDICLGKETRAIFVSPEDNRTVNNEVKDFLQTNEVKVTLTLVSDWNDNAKKVIICRNFLPYSKAIRTINGIDIPEKEFTNELQNAIFECVTEKPSFRQLIAHNNRYNKVATEQTLRCLEGMVSEPVYETLHLYMLGCINDEADTKQTIFEKLSAERRFKNRLEKNQNFNALVAESGIINAEIEDLEKKKNELNLNPEFESTMSDLSDIKIQITLQSTQLNNLKLRRSILEEAQNEILKQRSSIDIDSLKQIYNQAGMFISDLQHSFEDLVEYHNKMIVNKAEFVGKEIPDLDKRIEEIQNTMILLRQEENMLSSKIRESSLYQDYETIVSNLTEKYQRIGALSELIGQIKEVDEEISSLEKRVEDIDSMLFADEFKKRVQQQLDKFNTYFAKISNQLYGETYGLVYDIVHNSRLNMDFYKFSIKTLGSNAINISTGKKQGEIVCFDLAYILFADLEGIPCLHFGLYDKKELFHDNQLIETFNFVNNNPNLQFIASMLRCRLPKELNDEKYFVTKLSQQHKLFGF